MNADACSGISGWLRWRQALVPFALLLASGCVGATVTEPNPEPEADADADADAATTPASSGQVSVVTSGSATTGSGITIEAAGGAPASTDGAEQAAGGAAGAGGQGVDLGIGQGDLTLLLVFDKSGSMQNSWEGRARWEVANEALLAGMQPYLDNLTVGAIFFPMPSECEVAPLDDPRQVQYLGGRKFVERWNEVGAAAIADGSTPMGLAFQEADAAVEDAKRLGLLEKRFRLIVVTDGEPNCETDPTTLAPYAARWRELGVETHVLGLPGSQVGADLLNAIAKAGGTDEFVSPGGYAELEDTFDVLAK